MVFDQPVDPHAMVRASRTTPKPLCASAPLREKFLRAPARPNRPPLTSMQGAFRGRGVYPERDTPAGERVNLRVFAPWWQKKPLEPLCLRAFVAKKIATKTPRHQVTQLRPSCLRALVAKKNLVNLCVSVPWWQKKLRVALNLN